MIWNGKQNYNRVRMKDLDILEVIVNKGDDVLYPGSLTLGFFWLIARCAGRGKSATNSVDDSHSGPILSVFLGYEFWCCRSRLWLGFAHELIQAASTDDTFNFIFKLQVFICIVAVVPMVPIVLVVISLGGGSIHPSS